MNGKLIKRMLTGILITTSSFAGEMLNAQNTGDTLRISLDDALKVALSENLTVQVADQEVTKQKYAKKGTYASLYPQIDLSGSYQRTLQKLVMHIFDKIGRNIVTELEKH